jgi:hypothetical protein
MLPLFALVVVFLSFVLEFSDGLGIPGTGQLLQPFWRCGFTILFWFLISGTLTKSLFVTFVFAVGTKFFLVSWYRAYDPSSNGSDDMYRAVTLPG